METIELLEFWSCPSKLLSNEAWTEWLRKGAASGDAWCCWQLALILKDQKGSADQLTQAINLLKKSAKTGFAPAEFSLGVAYSFGEGVSEEKYSALRWYRRSANHGFPAGAYNVGHFLENGIGCQVDIAGAAHWYRIAANMGDSDADVSLANLYATRMIATGDTTHEDRVVFWYSQAAKHGNGDGIFNLAFCYRNGTGVVRNASKYRQLLGQAAKLGHPDARRILASERKKISRSKLNK